VGRAHGFQAVPSELTATEPLRSLKSPTAPDANFFTDCDNCCCFIAAPATLAAPPSVGEAFAKLLQLVAPNGTRALSQERSFYRLAATVLPAFAESVGDQRGSMEAQTLFTRAALCTRHFKFALQCKPELHVHACIDAAQRRYRPGFNGEIKTAGYERALEQGVCYTLLDMVRIFFPALFTDKLCAWATPLFHAPADRLRAHCVWTPRICGGA
jgi:hypothetical protein